MSTTDVGSGARATPGARLRTFTCLSRRDTTVKEEMPGLLQQECHRKGRFAGAARADCAGGNRDRVGTGEKFI
ncbi:hypothetical protein GCM10027590_39340 [Nocardiopsis nanhaiensis]